MAPALIELTNLHCERDQRVLFSGVNFSIEPGDIVQIEGPNGSGKTTLLRALTTLSPDYEGEIRWQGTSLVDSSADYYANLLFIGHFAGVKKTLTPRENLQWLSGLHQPADVTAIDHALHAVGLYGYEDMPGYQLSAGQQRRIALARLHLSTACVWVLDEPFTAIDHQGVSELETLLSTHARRGGVVILTTHQALSLSGVKSLNLTHYQPKFAATTAQQVCS